MTNNKTNNRHIFFDIWKISYEFNMSLPYGTFCVDESNLIEHDDFTISHAIYDYIDKHQSEFFKERNFILKTAKYMHCEYLEMSNNSDFCLIINNVRYA